MAEKCLKCACYRVSIREFYCTRITHCMEMKGKSININREWDNIKKATIQAASDCREPEEKGIQILIYRYGLTSLIR